MNPAPTAKDHPVTIGADCSPDKDVDAKVGDTITFSSEHSYALLVFTGGRHPFSDTPPFCVPKGGSLALTTVREGTFKYEPKCKDDKCPGLQDYSATDAPVAPKIIVVDM